MMTSLSRYPKERWLLANEAYINMSLECLRKLIHLRVLWLRTLWTSNELHSYRGMAVSDNEADRLLKSPDPNEEDVFYLQDARASNLVRSIESLEKDINALLVSMIKEGVPPALYMLSKSFGLTPFEAQVLLLASAPEIDPSFSRLFAYIQDDPSCVNATMQLALDLFKPKEGMLSHRLSLMAGAPLRRFGLVTYSDGSEKTSIMSRPLKVNERIIEYLQGINRLDLRLTNYIYELSNDPLPKRHQEVAKKLTSKLYDLAKDGRWPVVSITGKAGLALSFACELGRLLGLKMFQLEIASSDTPSDIRELSSILQREARLIQIGLFIKASSWDDKQIISHLRQLIEKGDLFLVIEGNVADRIQRRVIQVNLPRLDLDDRSDIWMQALNLAHITVPEGIEGLARQFDYDSKSVSKLVDQAKVDLIQSGPIQSGPIQDNSSQNISIDDLWRYCRNYDQNTLEGLITSINPIYTWSDIVLPKDVENQLREIANQVTYRLLVERDWGFSRHLSKGSGISVLFSGQSGTGKTMAAEVLANHLNLDLKRIDLSLVMSKYIGETEKNLSKIFDAAEGSGSILFFDEADALFGKRTEIKDSHDRYANVEVNYLLQRMEDYSGLVILATNRKSDLDVAFLRRLRFQVEFPFPDAASRTRIWKLSFPKNAPIHDIDYGTLGQMDISGGNIKNIAINAAFLAASESSKIEMRHIMHAAKREYVKIDRAFVSSI